ncbi:hypothetical protein EP331_07720 [bacterium]|nr:MAG: hypothetical protein EP331_07720 [bacterium]
MKTSALILALFLLSGCYTQLRIQKSYDYGYTSNPDRANYSGNADYADSDSENYAYQEGYEDGYDKAAQVFTDWRVASRWNPYYNRFYWVDPYWGGAYYDPFLWDPYWGYYGAWGVSYYAVGYSTWMGVRSPYWGWNWSWPNHYWANVVIHRDGSNGNTSWSYGPRETGANGSLNVRASRTGLLKTNTSGNVQKGSTTKIRAPRSSSGSISIPTKRSSSGSSGSSSRGSSSSGSSRPSRSGNNEQAYIPATNSSGTSTTSTGISYTKPRSTGSSVKSSSTNSNQSSSGSSKSSARPSRSGKN